MLLMVPRIHMDSKEFAHFETEIESTATFRPVFFKPWSRNGVVWGLCSGPDADPAADIRATTQTPDNPIV